MGRLVTPAGRYVHGAALYGVGGYWPRHRNGVAKPTQAPDEPPQSLTDAQIETVNRFLTKRGYIVVRGAEGVVKLVKML